MKNKGWSEEIVNREAVNILVMFLKQEFSHITPTAIELWNDKKFIERRIDEQWFYLADLCMRYDSGYGSLSKNRADELGESARFLYRKFENRLKELNGDVA